MDYLPPDATEYSINVSPTTIATRRDVLGNVWTDPVQEVNFIFASRNVYSSDVLQNLTNLGFFDDVMNWMIAQNKNRNFPVIDEGTVLSIMPTLTQYLFEAGANSGRYQIQCKLRYRRNN